LQSVEVLTRLCANLNDRYGTIGRQHLRQVWNRNCRRVCNDRSNERERLLWVVSGLLRGGRLRA